jgi:septal ring factor EnvC (AmiA/AmiB activator)
VESQVAKARPDCPIEESPKLHASDNNVKSRFVTDVTDAPRPRLPWLLVAASLLLAALLAYTLFGAYLPAKRRLASLERELRDVYAREAELQTKVARNEQNNTLREQQLIAVSGERDALARRLEELEKELALARGNRRR